MRLVRSKKLIVLFFLLIGFNHEVSSANHGIKDIDVEKGCLVATVFFEARGESFKGKAAVANVVLNRVYSKSYPTTICKVMLQPWQFSFVKQLPWKRIQQVMDGSSKGMKTKDALALKEAKRLARIALEKPLGVLPSNVLHYHALSVKPYWAKKMQKHKVIGQHVFYKQRGKP